MKINAQPPITDQTDQTDFDNQDVSGKTSNGSTIKATNTTNKITSAHSTSNCAQVAIKMNNVENLDIMSASRYLQGAVDFTYYLNDGNIKPHKVDSVSFHINKNDGFCILSISADENNSSTSNNLAKEMENNPEVSRKTTLVKKKLILTKSPLKILKTSLLNS